MRKLLVILFVVDCLLFTASFVTGTFANTKLVRSIIAPAKLSAEESFDSLKRGKVITASTKGFPLLVETSRAYCESRSIDAALPGQISRFENRFSFAPMPVFFAVLNDGKLLQIEFPDFTRIFDSTVGSPNIIVSCSLFGLAMLLMIINFVVESREKP